MPSNGTGWRSGTNPRWTSRPGTSPAAEALLRWRGADGHITSAEHFITVAEETGLILEIGRWVLKEACREAARWPSGDGRPAGDPTMQRLRSSGFWTLG